MFVFIGKVLSEFSFFVPDIILVALIAMFFNGSSYSELVFVTIAYLGTLYGERMYYRLYVIKTNINELLLKHGKAIEDSINSKGLVTFNQLEDCLLALDDIYSEEIDSIKQELQGENAVEMDSKKE